MELHIWQWDLIAHAYLQWLIHLQWPNDWILHMSYRIWSLSAPLFLGFGFLWFLAFSPTLKFLDMLDNIKGYIHKAIVKESTNKYVLWNSQIWKLLYFSERNLFKMFPWEKQRQSSKKKFSGSEFLKYQLKIDILFFLLIYLLKSLKLFLMTLL